MREEPEEPYEKAEAWGQIVDCLMDNHAHLAIETSDVPLSRIMAGLQSSYTQAFNRRHRRVGHLFQGRGKYWGQSCTMVQAANDASRPDRTPESSL